MENLEIYALKKIQDLLATAGHKLINFDNKDQLKHFLQHTHVDDAYSHYKYGIRFINKNKQIVDHKIWKNLESMILTFDTSNNGIYYYTSVFEYLSWFSSYSTSDEIKTISSMKLNSLEEFVIQCDLIGL
jgi:hypothetical protein